MPAEMQAMARQPQELYARYVRPLENAHLGEYVAVSPDGTTVLAPTLLQVMERAEHVLALGNFVFNVGDIAVDTWR